MLFIFILESRIDKFTHSQILKAKRFCIV